MVQDKEKFEKSPEHISRGTASLKVQTQEADFHPLIIHCILGSHKTALSVEEFEHFSNSNIVKDDFGRWTCNLCGLQAAAKIHLVRHLEAKHVTLPLISCPICLKTCKTSHAMRMHMKNYHDTTPGKI